MSAFTVIDHDQRSAEWFTARSGRLTSSNVDAIFMQGRTKGSESVTKRDLRIRLALERMSGRSLDGDGFRNADMQYGVEREPDARLAYEAKTGKLIREAGFCAHNDDDNDWQQLQDIWVLRVTNLKKKAGMRL